MTIARSRLLGEAIDQAVADLAVGAGDEHDRFPHAQNYTEPSCRFPSAACSSVWQALSRAACLAGRTDRPHDRAGGAAAALDVRLQANDAGGLLPRRRARYRRSLSLDRVVNDGTWAGSRRSSSTAPISGKYLFEVRAKAASRRSLYSRGFASIYGEWETTAGGEDRAADVPRVGAVALAVGGR